MARSNRGLIGQYAGFFSRAVALIIDIILISVGVILINALIALPVTFFLQINPQTCTRELALARTYEQLICQGINIIWVLVALLAAPVYFTFFFSTTGQTIGKYVMGVRVVRTDGRQMSILGSLGRWFGYFVSLIPLGIGFLWVTLDDRRQGWHDKLFHTVVVYAWRAEQDEFLLDRLRRYFKRRHDVASALAAVTTKTTLDASLYDLVTITFGEYDRLNQILGMMQDAVAKGQLEVVNATVLVKDVDGSVSVVGTSDLAVGSDPVMFGSGDSHIPDYELQPVMQDIPPDNFVIAVVLTESSADNLTKMVARRTAAAIRRYDLGDNPNNVSGIQAPGALAQPVHSAPPPTASQIAQRQQTAITPVHTTATTGTTPSASAAIAVPGASGSQALAAPSPAPQASTSARPGDPVGAAASQAQAVVYSARETIVIEDGEFAEVIETTAIVEVELPDGAGEEVEAVTSSAAAAMAEGAASASATVAATKTKQAETSASAKSKASKSAATKKPSAKSQVTTKSAGAAAPDASPSATTTKSSTKQAGSTAKSQKSGAAKKTAPVAASSAAPTAPLATPASAALEAERAAAEAAEAAKEAIQAAQEAIAAAEAAAEAARIAARESAT